MKPFTYSFLKNIKKIWFFLVGGMLLFGSFSSTHAVNSNQFHILPEVEDKTTIQKITKIVSDGKEYSWATEKTYGEEVNADIWAGSGSTVMERYQKIANSREYSLSEKMAAWVLDWNSILEYVVYAIRFISQIGILIWAGMIIYSWYLYAVSAFWGSWWWGEKAKNAIIGVVVITFSYAIMKLLTAAFLGS